MIILMFNKFYVLFSDTEKVFSKYLVLITKLKKKSMSC